MEHVTPWSPEESVGGLNTSQLSCHSGKHAEMNDCVYYKKKRRIFVRWLTLCLPAIKASSSNNCLQQQRLSFFCIGQWFIFLKIQCLWLNHFLFTGTYSWRHVAHPLRWCGDTSVQKDTFGTIRILYCLICECFCGKHHATKSCLTLFALPPLTGSYTHLHASYGFMVMFL